MLPAFRWTCELMLTSGYERYDKNNLCHDSPRRLLPCVFFETPNKSVGSYNALYPFCSSCPVKCLKVNTQLAADWFIFRSCCRGSCEDEQRLFVITLCRNSSAPFSCVSTPQLLKGRVISRGSPTLPAEAQVCRGT